MKIIELHKSVTDSNDRDAEKLRKELKERGTFLINVMSSPGAGKTTLLSKIITDLKNEVRIAVMEADIDASVDAERIEALGAKVFYAAVSQEEDGIQLSGSRALGIVAQGETIEEAEKIAEEACGLVKGNVYHRRDVGTADLIQKRIDHMEAIRNA